MNDKIMQIKGLNQVVIKGEERTLWTRIGTAFPNKDGSYNLVLDYFPAHGRIKLQLRELDEVVADEK